MAERNYPNDYFAWFNDDKRLAILSLDTTSTTSGERTTEKYDTFQGDGNLSGTITTFANYTSTVSGTTLVTDASHGLATNDRITITSSPDSYYDTASSDSDGKYSITKVDANNFYITATYSAEDSGSWTSLFVNDGLRITYKSKYETVTGITEDLDTDIGLDTSLHPSLVCYAKSRLYEDQGNMEQANYFRQMYENQIMKQRSRKSGVRGLAVPNL
tara:strand:- start:70 stop:717 length:648 start_codon:yes stop_codon:yes gene_type:complete